MQVESQVALCRHAKHYAGVLRVDSFANTGPDRHQITHARQQTKLLPCSPEIIWPEDIQELATFERIPLGQRISEDTLPEEFDSLVMSYIHERFDSSISEDDPIAENIRDLILYMGAFAPAGKDGFASFDGAAVLAMTSDETYDVRNIPQFVDILIDCGIIVPAFQLPTGVFEIERAIDDYSRLRREEFSAFLSELTLQQKVDFFSDLKTVAEVAYGTRYFITDSMVGKLLGILGQYEE